MTPKEAREQSKAKVYQEKLNRIGEEGLDDHYRWKLRTVQSQLRLLGVSQPDVSGTLPEQIEILGTLVDAEAKRQGVSLVFVDITDRAVANTREKIAQHGLSSVSQVELDRLRFADSKGEAGRYNNGKLFAWQVIQAS